MKKILSILLLLSGVSYAQIVDIPDSNFKQALLTTAYVENLDGFFITIDANSDGEIQFSEAQNISRIEISNSSITDLTGIEAFFNLRYFDCSNNQLAFLDMQNFAELTDLNCSENSLSNILVAGCNSLANLNCSGNQLSFLDLSELPQLNVVECQNNNISILATINCPNLSFISYTDNPLTFVDFTNCSALTSLNFNTYNALSTLNVSGCTNLNFLNVVNTQISTITLQNLVNLSTLLLYSNASLSSITITNCPSISNLDCSNNTISSLDVSGLLNLTQLNCGSNPLSALDVSALTNLTTFFCNDTQVTSLDVSNLENLTNFWFFNNSQLETVFAKNGQNESFTLDNTPNLSFICVDDAQISTVQNQVDALGMTLTVVSSYCTFVPGGDYNTITGSILFDYNNNGCDLTDLTQPNIRINLNDGNEQGATFTNNSGNYVFYTQAGNFELMPIVENPSFFIITPQFTTINFPTNNNNTQTQNFCITANGIHPDLEIVIAPVFPARPGFEAVYKIVYKNIGNQIMSQQYGVNFFYNDNLMDFISASVLPSSQASGGIQWDYTNLMPFESRSILVTMLINTPTNTNPVNLDDVLTFTSVISPQAGDENVIDNTFVFNQTVVGSYDPNDIACLQGDVVPPSAIGDYLHYFIRFENTGTAPAENIVVTTEIDPLQFDINSLQMLSTSHEAYVRLKENKIEFIFQNIELESGGHGNVLLKVRSNEALEVGNFVSKIANIFFDYNYPIETNEAETLFQALSIENPVLDNLISLYPNPVKEVVNITIKDNASIKTIELYDVQGRLLQTQLVNNVSSELNLSQRATGMYFIKITTDQGIKVKKLVKE